MKKNVGSQLIACQLVSVTDGSNVTSGTTTVTVEIDGAAGTGGTATHIANGKWEYAPIQADTNADHITFQFTNTSAVSVLLNVYTNFPQTVDNDVLAAGATGFAAINTDVELILADTAEIGTAGIGLTNLGGSSNDWNNTKTGYTLTATTGLGNQTANITGNLSGTVGSVTGAINTAAGTIQTLDDLDAAQDSKHDANQVLIDRNADLLESNRGAHTWQGNTYYIKPETGNDGNAGTRASPRKTIDGAMDLVTTGNHDVIFILADGGAGGTVHTQAGTTTIDKDYVFIRGPGRDVVITNSGVGVDTFTVTGNGVELSGFQIDTAGSSNGKGVQVTGADFFKANHVWFNDTRGDALALNDCDNFQIICNNFQNSGVSGSGHGLVITAGNGETCNYGHIHDNRFNDVAGDAIRLVTTGTGANNATVIDENIIQGATGDGIDITAAGSNDTQIFGNAFANITGSDISDTGTATVQANNEQWAKHSIATEVRLAELDAANIPADLDTITGTDGVTLATAQALYAPAKAGDNMGTVSSVTGNVDGNVSGTVTLADGAHGGSSATLDLSDYSNFTGAGSGLTALATGTSQSGTASTIVLAASAAFADNVLNGNIIGIHTGTGAGQSRVITSNTLADDTVNVTPNWTTNPGADSQYEIVQGSANITAVSNAAEDLPTATALTAAQDDLDIITGASGVNLLTATQASIDAIETDTGTTIPGTITTAQNDLDIITGASGVNLLTATQASIDAIETDTGTTIPGTITTAQNDLNIITGASGVNLLTATQASIDAIEVDTGTTLQAELDAIQAATITNAAGVDIAADIIALKAETVNILADTAEIGTAGVGLTDLGGMSTAMKAEVNTEVDTGLTDYAGPTNAQMEARTPTAAQLAYITAHAATAVPVTFSGGSTTTAVFVNVDGSTASTSDDVYNSRVLVFNVGTLNFQIADITAYVGSTKTATISAVTTSVTGSHTAILV